MNRNRIHLKEGHEYSIRVEGRQLNEERFLSREDQRAALEGRKHREQEKKGQKWYFCVQQSTFWGTGCFSIQMYKGNRVWMQFPMSDIILLLRVRKHHGFSMWSLTCTYLSWHLFLPNPRGTSQSQSQSQRNILGEWPYWIDTKVWVG